MEGPLENRISGFALIANNPFTAALAHYHIMCQSQVTLYHPSGPRSYVPEPQLDPIHQPIILLSSAAHL
jgi:hypothetical protein